MHCNSTTENRVAKVIYVCENHWHALVCGSVIILLDLHYTRPLLRPYLLDLMLRGPD